MFMVNVAMRTQDSSRKLQLQLFTKPKLKMDIRFELGVVDSPPESAKLNLSTKPKPKHKKLIHSDWSKSG